MLYKFLNANKHNDAKIISHLQMLIDTKRSNSLKVKITVLLSIRFSDIVNISSIITRLYQDTSHHSDQLRLTPTSLPTTNCVINRSQIAMRVASCTLNVLIGC